MLENRYVLPNAEMKVSVMSFSHAAICNPFSRARILNACLILVVALIVAGCSSRAAIDDNIISVEGLVMVYGNVPFTAIILKTNDNNSYILKMNSEQRAQLMTPVRLRVTGRLYLGEWNARAFAHIEVAVMEAR